MRGKDESPKGRPRVTIKDLAEDLGMSVSTISRAFQKGSPISDRAREIVLNRAEEMGYKANPFARSLVGKKSRIVGVLVSRISSTFYYEILNRIAEYLREDNLTLMLVAGEHVHEVQEGLNMLMAYDPLAVLVISSYSDADSIALSPTARNKLLYFNRVPADSFSVGVAYDNHLAGARMADYLAGLGHRRLAYLSSGMDSSTDHERHQGFSARCVETGLDQPVLFRTKGFTYEGGMAAAADVVARLDDLDAVFCAADILALGLMDGMRHNFHVSVPENLSIAGCDDIAMASWPSHSLTTLRMPRDTIVRELIRLFRAIIDDCRPSPEIIRVSPGDVVVRNSTDRNMRR